MATNVCVYTTKLLTMTENENVTIYRFGFLFNNIYFCWKHKNLYRMPYKSNHRCYEKRLLKMQKVGGSFGYWICGIFKSMKNLKEITKEVLYQETIIIQNELPF